jgi:hypothetical protein
MLFARGAIASARRCCCVAGRSVTALHRAHVHGLSNFVDRAHDEQMTVEEICSKSGDRRRWRGDGGLAQPGTCDLLRQAVFKDWADKGKCQRSTLHEAAHEGDIGTVQQLLDRGGSRTLMGALDEHGWTAAHLVSDHYVSCDQCRSRFDRTRARWISPLAMDTWRC